MPARMDWHGDAYRASVRAELTRRTQAACIDLAAGVRAEISQPGTLRYHPRTKSGKASKTQKTIYDFTHSRPGNPPSKQTGHLRRSIAWEVLTAPRIVGRVGTNLKYGRYLELGTRKLKARPFLRPTLKARAARIRAIMTKTFPAGGLPSYRSNQFRSGHLGKGAAAAGYH